MRAYTSQTRFSAGELSPRMHMQFDTEYYKFGASAIRNMVVTQQGTVKRRQGTEYIQSYEGTYARVLPFQLSPDSTAGTPFPLVVSDNGKLYIEGAFSDTMGIILNANPTFDLGSSNWTTNGVGTVEFSTGYVLVTPSTVVDQDTVIYQAVVLAEAGEYLIRFDATSGGINPSPVRKIIVGTTAGASDVVLSYFEADWYKFTVASPSTVYIGVKVLGGDYVVTEEGRTYGTQTASILEVEMRKRNVGSAASFVTHSYDHEDIRNLRYAMVPARNAMYMVTPKKEPMVLEYNIATSSWSFGPVPFLHKPTSWTTGNYPRCVTFFQGRSWWAGVSSHPETIWASVSLSYQDMKTGPAAADGLEFTINAKGRIEWIAGVRELLVGTEFGEYVVQAQNGVLQPSDIGVYLQSADGGSSVAPLPIGSAAMFVSADLRKIKFAQYTRDDESWITRDATVHAEHMFQKGITEICYARNPDSILWVAMPDGKLAGATVFSFNQPLAWHLHDIGNRVISICSLQENGVSSVYLVTYRAAGLALERMSSGPALDSRVIKSSNVDFNSMSGLNHLSGMTVDVHLDGFYYDSLVVSSTGTLSLPIYCLTAYVGVPFDSHLKTLRMDFTLSAGSSVSLKKTSATVDIAVFESTRPMVNNTFVLNRLPELVIDEPNLQYTGVLTYPLVGYNNGEITIKSRGPYPLEVCGVFPKVEGSTL